MNGIKTLEPDYFCPAAGPVIFPFLDENLSQGKGNIFIHQDKLDQFLKAKNIKNLIYLRPGDEFDNRKVEPIKPPSTEEIVEYRKSVEDVWSAINIEFSKTALENVLVDRLNQIKDLSFAKVPILIFRWGHKEEERVVVNLNTKQYL